MNVKCVVALMVLAGLSALALLIVNACLCFGDYL